MTVSGRMEKPFTIRFIDAGAQFLLELTNTSDEPFDAVRRIQPKAKAVLSHRTLIDGRTADPEHDLLGRLKVVAGEAKPYVLDISWEDAEGKTRYQRIPVGH